MELAQLRPYLCFVSAKGVENLRREPCGHSAAPVARAAANDEEDTDTPEGMAGRKQEQAGSRRSLFTDRKYLLLRAVPVTSRVNVVAPDMILRQ
jgi:hypothetical protein